VQRYIALDGHIYGFGPLGINDAFYSSLDEDKQAVILAAGKKAVQWNRRRSREQETEALAIARAENVTIIQLSDDMRKRFARLAQPAAMRWLRRNIDTPALVDRVTAEVRRLVEESP